jgi:murein DD-endopeptidase MepM/ murein hydrolase activator NlpD
MRTPSFASSSLATLLALGCPGWALAQAHPGPDPGGLKARIISALGGVERLRALKSLRAEGSMEGVSGFPGTYRMEALAPNRRLVNWDIRYLQQTLAIDGDTGWERSAAVRELAGDELVRDRRDARFNVLFTLLEQNLPFTVTQSTCPEGETANLILFKHADGGTETFGIDPRTDLPICHVRTEDYEEGPTQIWTEYSDYRRVDGLTLPFTVHEARPDNSLKISIARYEINPKIDARAFRNPEPRVSTDPIDLVLSTLPARVFKEPDGNYTIGPQRYWGMYFYPTESWSFDLVVKEKHGRFLEPTRARVDLYAGSQRVSSQEWEAGPLAKMRRYPVTRFTPLGEIYGFRHDFAVPATDAIDRLTYTFEAQAADGHSYSRTLEIPVTTYQTKTRLIFPMKGKFLVTSGHEYYEKEHKYERSQQFAIDIVALGENFEFASHNGATMEDYIGYARREILAPAAGRVVFARNDIPDGAMKASFLKLPDAITAPAGNVVIIDHGNSEFSIFCHMHQGSVRVRMGDTVVQGQVIGLLGAAGSPGLPHLHYQLQAGPHIFGDDGLPLAFTNIERVAWLGRYGSEDERGSAPVTQPRSGVFMEAR